MTVYVKNGRNSIEFGMSDMMNAMKEDYARFMPPEKSETTKKMNLEFAEKLTYTKGKKYIKVLEKKGGVKCFVVAVDDDKKFKKGDILMAAGYNAPARNKARGNILEGNYAINWTGACYL